MAVKVREKFKDSGVRWVFINHKGTRRSKKIRGKANSQQSCRGGVREA